MTTLIELNAARAVNGKAPLKNWKESKAKLLAAIAKETPAPAVAAKVTTTDKVSEKPAKTDKPSVNVAEIAKHLGLNPKVARAKLRKLNVDRTNVKAIRKALTK